MPRRRGESTAADLLVTWTDSDTAMQIVGTSLGVFETGALEPADVLFEETPLRNALFDVLLSLVEGARSTCVRPTTAATPSAGEPTTPKPACHPSSSPTIDLEAPSPYLAELARMRRERDDALGRAEFAEGVAAGTRAAAPSGRGTGSRRAPGAATHDSHRAAQAGSPAGETRATIDPEDQSVLDVLYAAEEATAAPAAGEPAAERETMAIEVVEIEMIETETIETEMIETETIETETIETGTVTELVEIDVVQIDVVQIDVVQDDVVEVDVVEVAIAETAVVGIPAASENASRAPRTRKPIRSSRSRRRSPGPSRPRPTGRRATQASGRRRSRRRRSPAQRRPSPRRSPRSARRRPARRPPRSSSSPRPSRRPKRPRRSRRRSRRRGSAGAPSSSRIATSSTSASRSRNLGSTYDAEAMRAKLLKRGVDENDPSVVWLTPPPPREEEDDDVEDVPVAKIEEPAPRRPKWSGYTLDKSRSHLSSVDRLAEG